MVEPEVIPMPPLLQLSCVIEQPYLEQVSDGNRLSVLPEQQQPKPLEQKRHADHDWYFDYRYAPFIK